MSDLEKRIAEIERGADTFAGDAENYGECLHYYIRFLARLARKLREQRDGFIASEDFDDHYADFVNRLDAEALAYAEGKDA